MNKMSQNGFICLFSVFVLANYILMHGAVRGNKDVFEGFQGKELEFKIEVQPGTLECYYQQLKDQAEMHVVYEVVTGVDITVDIFVKDSSKKLIEQDSSQRYGLFRMKFEKGGIYEICIDNTRERFISKLVFLGIYVLFPEHWDSIAPQEVQEVKMLEAVSALSSLIEEMRMYQTHSRLSLMSDWYLTKGNNVYVMYYSFAQCLVIVLTSCAQVYVLRRFFRTVPVTNPAKSRVIDD